MPEDSKKNQEKRRNEPKEQRKPRSSRTQVGKPEKKAERIEESKSAPKVAVPQKPVYEDPGPEFYKNLKRETEEILKITEEQTSKYKKKEIQSNWSKYEMPIEIEEHDVGADYEKLIQAPLSIGGHFQFKHEKSWDVNTGPSLYDKYFEINMDNLSLAVSTIPFYERNEIDKSLFSETDMLSMNNRATKYKQKYYDDKISYTTPETKAQDRILNSLKETLSNKGAEVVKTHPVEKDEISDNIEEDRSIDKDDINLDFKNLIKTENVPSPVQSKQQIERDIENKSIVIGASSVDKSNIDVDDLLLEEPINKTNKETKNEKIPHSPKEIATTENIAAQPVEVTKINSDLSKSETATKRTEIKHAQPEDKPVDMKNPVIESPEDLEKWLDDFLDE